MWSEHIHNKHAVQGVFGSNVPALEGLELMQLVLDGVGGLDVALNLEQLPDTVPARWKERGCDCVQLRFRFIVDELVLHRQPKMEIGKSQSSWTRAGCASLRRMVFGTSPQPSMTRDWNSIPTAAVTTSFPRAGFLARHSISALARIARLAQPKQKFRRTQWLLKK
jgi:hypothetical protein